jgi:hypothetical protein
VQEDRVRRVDPALDGLREVAVLAAPGHAACYDHLITVTFWRLPNEYRYPERQVEAGSW